MNNVFNQKSQPRHAVSLSTRTIIPYIKNLLKSPFPLESQVLEHGQHGEGQVKKKQVGGDGKTERGNKGQNIPWVFYFGVNFRSRAGLYPEHQGHHRQNKSKHLVYPTLPAGEG